MKILLAALWAVLALGLVAAPVAADSRTAAPEDTTMLVRPGDSIEVQLTGYRDTGGTWSVDAAGDYQMAAVNKIHVAGLTDEQAAARIREAVWTLYKSEPEVQVRVLHRVSVLGQVRSPGLYQIDGSERVADVIAKAGGTTEQASLHRVRVASEDGSRSKNVDADLNSGRSLRGLGLRSGDVIYVPARRGITDWRNWATIASILGSAALIYDVTRRN